MRVQLVKPSGPVAEIDASTTATPALPLEGPTTQTEQVGRKTLFAILTTPAAVISVCVLATGLLVWSLVFRLPAGHAPIPVNARDASGSTPARISDAQLEELRQSVQQITASLMKSPDELGPLLYLLETRAKGLGWRANIEMRPALPRPGGLTNLTLHPVTIRLEDEGEQPSPYSRLLDWLRSISTLPTRAEVTVLRLHSAGAGLAKAEVEVRLFRLSASIVEPESRGGR